MATKLLTEPEFRATLIAPMEQVSGDAQPPCPFWDYFDEIRPVDFQNHVRGSEVSYALTNAPGTHQHVLVDTEDPDIFMVLVIDLRQAEVIGHRLIDLKEEYDFLDEEEG